MSTSKSKSRSWSRSHGHYRQPNLQLRVERAAFPSAIPPLKNRSRRRKVGCLSESKSSKTEKSEDMKSHSSKTEKSEDMKSHSSKTEKSEDMKSHSSKTEKSESKVPEVVVGSQDVIMSSQENCE